MRLRPTGGPGGACLSGWTGWHPTTAIRRRRCGRPQGNSVVPRDSLGIRLGSRVYRTTASSPPRCRAVAACLPVFFGGGEAPIRSGAATGLLWGCNPISSTALDRDPSALSYLLSNITLYQSVPRNYRPFRANYESVLAIKRLHYL